MLPLLPPLGREDMVEHRAMLLVELRPVLLVQLAQGFEAVAAVRQLYERKRSALDLAHQQVVQRASDAVGLVTQFFTCDNLRSVTRAVGRSSPAQQAAVGLEREDPLFELLAFAIKVRHLADPARVEQLRAAGGPIRRGLGLYRHRVAVSSGSLTALSPCIDVRVPILFSRAFC